MNKTEIQTIQAIVEKSFKKEVSKAVNTISSALNIAEEGKKNYFKETETLLYNYAVLKLKVIEDARELENGGPQLKGKSKDIVRFSAKGGSRLPEDVVAEEYYNSRRASMERTRLRVKDIERGLNKIRASRYYRVIELKYGIPPEDFDWDSEDASDNLKQYEPITIKEISEIIPCDESTVKRNRNKLVNTLKIAIFGGDAT